MCAAHSAVLGSCSESQPRHSFPAGLCTWTSLLSVSLQRCSTCRAMKTLRAYTGSSFLSFFKEIFLRFFLIYPFVLIVADCTSITSYSPDVSSGFVGIAHCSVVLCTDFLPVQCSGNVHVTCCNFSWSTKFMSCSILTLHQL